MAAEKVVEGVMRVEPMIATGISMFVPGAAPVVAMVQPWMVLAAPYLERALDDIAKGNSGDVLGAFLELMQHVSKGGPNSPILSASPVAPNKTAAQPAFVPDPSAVGSG
jgi:hypothetical protein